jgi:antitoxin ParD1/3/4
MPKRKAQRSADSIQDANGFIHGPYGSFNPVTGEGMPFEAPPEYMHEILRQLIQEGLDSGPAEPFDFDEFMDEMFGTRDSS